MTFFAKLSLGCCFVGLALLTGLLLWAWWGKKEIAVRHYKIFRGIGSVIIASYGVFTIYRVGWRVFTQCPVDDGFRPELVGYIVFWVLFPPLWFFFEYYATDAQVIRYPIQTDLETILKHTKDYADFASKIWAAVLAVLAVLVTLMRKLPDP